MYLKNLIKVARITFRVIILIKVHIYFLLMVNSPITLIQLLF
jgi:hypothetical protein